MSRVLLVVPTLGQRPELLTQCLESIRSQSVPSDITVVSPSSELIKRAAADHGAMWVEDPGQGLAAAINAGVSTAPSDCEFTSWLGDDDLLTADSLHATQTALEEAPEAVVAFGPCTYIDEQGRTLWQNKAPSWVVQVLSWGPQLVPQPGMLVRFDAWRKLGGLDTSYSMAFDFDLLLRLKKLGSFVRVDHPVSYFRWHSSSLTVDDRTRNLQESQRAKRAALSSRVRTCAWLWEAPVRWATRFAAWRISRRSMRVSPK